MYMITFENVLYIPSLRLNDMLLLLTLIFQFERANSSCQLLDIQFCI